jgi:hypothetical protein
MGGGHEVVLGPVDVVAHCKQEGVRWIGQRLGTCMADSSSGHSTGHTRGQ